MNKLRPTIKLALFISVAGAFLAACSDDDDKKPSAPSKIITGIRVYKITDVISYEGDLDFTYDKEQTPNRCAWQCSIDHYKLFLWR
mgnify:CR=1 FL=1